MKIITLLVFLFPFGVSIGKRCPDEELLKPCHCTDSGNSVIKCDHIDSLDDLQKMFDNSMDYAFDVLTLSECVLPYLNASWFSSKKVQELNILSLTLIDLLDNTDVPVPSVNWISMEHTTILRGVRWQQFRVFNQLSHLYMWDVKVGKLGNDFKSSVSASLVYLNIMDVNVECLNEVDFQGKTNLEEITMPYNRIKILKNSFFKDQRSKLKVMDFSYNPIEYIPGDLFDGMTRLRTFSLDGALIKTLPKELLLLRSLGFLSVRENPLICNCKMSWLPEVLKSNPISYFLGNCESPPSLNSKSLRDLTDEDFEACYMSRGGFPNVSPIG